MAIPKKKSNSGLHLKYRGYPVEWCQDFLGVDFWSKQRKVLRAMAKNRRVAVAAGHAVGKSFLAANFLLYYAHTHPFSLGIITAPTWRQIHEVVLKNVLVLVDRAPHPEILYAERFAREIRMKNMATGETYPNWKIMGISSDSGGNFQGIHARHICMVIDEAVEIDREIWGSARTLGATDTSKILMLSNPTSNVGFFADAFQGIGKFETEHISVLESPNFTNEDVPEYVRKELVGQEWLQDTKDEYGEDSPYFIARALGQFPPEDSSTLIPRAFIEAAQKRESDPLQETGMQRSLGIDVGRDGDDLSVWVMLRGDTVEVLHKEERTPDSVEAARFTRDLIEKHNIRGGVAVDGTGGWGTGLIDNLRDAGVMVSEVKFHESSSEPDEHVNKRAEIYWNLRRFVRDRAVFPKELPTRLLRELNAIQYKHRGDKVLLQPKEEVKKRTGSSPDFADALALAYEARGTAPLNDAILDAWS